MATKWYLRFSEGEYLASVGKSPKDQPDSGYEFTTSLAEAVVFKTKRAAVEQRDAWPGAWVGVKLVKRG